MRVFVPSVLAVLTAFTLLAMPGRVETENSSTGHAVFWGNACYNVDCGPDAMGRELIAYVHSVECGRTVTGRLFADGPENSMYRVEVASSTEQSGCGLGGAQVTFTIDGLPTHTSGTWADNGEQRLDLMAALEFAAFSGTLTCDAAECLICSLGPCFGPVVQAYVDGNLCGERRVEGWLIVSAYSLLAAHGSESRSGCGDIGSTVTFALDGVPANETAVWSRGFHRLNLTTGDQIWGDYDCSDELDSGDALRIIRTEAGYPTYTADCFYLGEHLQLRPFDVNGLWGDIDCSSAVTLEDALKLLIEMAGAHAEQSLGCPPPGAVIQALPIPPP